MKKKFKAFTLVELIVVIAILGIIMAGIVSMFEPINSVYSNTSVLSAQRAAEQGITSYIIENTRYAQSIGIYQKQADADEAMTKFLANNPTDLQGNALTKADLEVICINNTNSYTLKGSASQTYSGRLIRKVSGKTACGETQPFQYDGTGNSYMAMGEDYYGPADYYIRIDNFTSAGFDVIVDSDYYYNKASKNKKFDRKDTSSNYTKASVVLANTAVPGDTGVVKIVDTSQYVGAAIGSRTDTSNKNTYIVYSLK